MSSSVIVSNMCKSLTRDAIIELFNCIGKIVAIDWQEGDEENSCRVTFENPQCVQAAVLLNNTPLGDRPLNISPAPSDLKPAMPMYQAANTPKVANNIKRLMSPAETIASLNAAARKLNPDEDSGYDATAGESELISRTVYVGNMVPSTLESEIRQLFIDCGNIVYVKMAGNPALGIRYAFIEFDSKEAALRAIGKSAEGALLAGRPVKVGPAMTSITKPETISATNTDPSRLEKAMERIIWAKRSLERKKKPRQKDSERSRASHSRHGSDRRSDKEITRSKSRKSRRSERSSYREEKLDIYKPRKTGARKRVTRMADRSQHGLVWDGFQWTQPSGLSVRQKSENLATKIMDVVGTDGSNINPSAQQAMVQQAHQQAALLREHMTKLKK